MSTEYSSFLAELARNAGEIALGYANAGVAAEEKAFLDFITTADIETESYIREAIQKRFPGESVLGEESGWHGDPDGRCWVVDPIDGTHNFARGLPFWGISIGLIADGRPIAGVVHGPAVGLTMIASEDKGVTINDRRVEAALPTTTLERPLLIYGMAKPPKTSEDCEVIRFSQDELGGTYRRLASASLSLAYTVRGSADVYIGIGDRIWDVCAGAVAATHIGLRHSLDFSNMPDGPMRFLCCREELYEQTAEWLYGAQFRLA